MRDSPLAQRQNADVMGGLAAHERGPTAASEVTRLLPSAAGVASLPSRAPLHQRPHPCRSSEARHQISAPSASHGVRCAYHHRQTQQ